MSSFARLVMEADTRGLKQGVTALDQIEAAAGTAETATKKVGAGFERSGSQAAAAAPKVKQFDSALDGAKQATLKAAAALGTLAAGFVSVAALGSSITQARQFSAAIAETSTLIKGTPAELEALSAAARGLAADFGGSATAQVQAFYQAISSGAAGVTEAQGILEAANKLAIGGATDVSTSVGILSGVINSYGADAITAAQVSDSLFVGMKAGVTTVGELSASLGSVIPTAKALGISFDETVAATAALTKNNLTTSAAVTSLNAALTGIVKPTAEASELAAQLGINFTAAGLQAKGLGGFLAEVSQKTGGNVDQMAQLFGSVEALKAALLFAGEAGGQYADILEQMGVKAGATDEAFQKMADNFDFRLNKLMGALGNIMITVGGAALSIMVPALEAVAAAVMLASDHADVLGVALGTAAAVMTVTLIPAMAASAVALGGYMVALGGLIAEFGVATVAAELFGLAFMASNPVGWAVGLGVAAGAIYAWATSADNGAQAADIHAAAAIALREAISGVSTASAEGKRQAEALAESTIAAARADVLAARIRMANAQAELNMNGGFAYAAEAQMAREELERTAAVLTGLIAEADRLGLSITKTKGELAASGGQTVDLSRLLAIAAGEASGIAAAVNTISMDSATSGATLLASNLGVALGVATSLNAVLNANAGISTSKAAPKSGADLSFGGSSGGLTTGVGNAGISFESSPDVKIANQQLAALQNWTAPKVSAASGGSGGAAAQVKKTTEALNSEIKALEQSANPMLAYNEGLARLNELKAAGLSDAGYAQGIKDLKDSMNDAVPAAGALETAISDGIGGAVDWMLSGFEGGIKGLLSTFKATITQMIAYALKNKIMISLGLGTTGSIGSIGSMASAATGGTASGASATSGLSGIIGSIGGVASSFISGASGLVTSLFGAGGGLGAAGTYLSATLGTATTGLAGFAAAAGAIALPLAAAAAVFSFFKTKTTQLDAGINITTTGLDTLVQSFETVNKKKYWGLLSKTSTNVTAAAAAIADPIMAVIDGIQSGILTTAAALGVGSDAFAAFGYSLSLSTKGMTDEEAQAAVTEALTDLGNTFAAMVPELATYQKAEEDAMTALARLSTNLSAVNQLFDILDHSFYSATVSGAGLASVMVDVFGSTEAMSSAVSAYWSAFYSEEEQLATSTRLLTASLAALGVTLPESRDAYRALVESVDTSTASGAELYAQLISLSSAFSEVTTVAETAAEAAATLAASMQEMVEGILNDADLMPTSKAQAAARADLGITEAAAISAAQSGDTEALASYLSDIKASTSSDLDYRAIAARVLAEFTGEVPAFASGGDHAGGVRMVGEFGPELELTGPSRIFSAGQTSEILGGSSSGGSDLLSELKAFREESRQLGLRADRHQKTTANTLEKWDKIGAPVVPSGDGGAW